MSEPKTLLQMAGAGSAAPDLTHATLLIIDAQEEYRSGALPLPDVDAAAGNIARLLAAIRAKGGGVVHVAHAGQPAGLFDRQAKNGQILNEVAARDGEPVVEKGLPNGFAGTDLDADLRALGHTDLVIAGFMTHMCVSSTARAALDLGYRTWVAGDATASRALPDPLGGPSLGHETVHRAALSALADRFSTVLTTGRICN